MKKLILFFALCLFSSLGFSQSAGNSGTYNTIGNTLQYYVIDTVANAGNIYWTLPGTLDANYSYSVLVVADSLSGSTAGTLTLYQANDVSGTFYVTPVASTFTVNGVQSSKLWEGSLWGGYKMKLQTVQSGTQSTKYRIWIVFHRLK